VSGQEALVAYLDNAATTPVLPEVAGAMADALTGQAFANPSAVHRWGLAARQAVEEGRRRVARAVGAAPESLTFTGGGTEANHLAILGVARARTRRGRHVVTTVIEHQSVLAACAALEADGWEVTRLPVGRDGRVGPEDVAGALRPDTVLCALAHVNNEIGAVQPVAEIAALLSGRDVPLHVDGVQALGKVATPYAAWAVTSAALSAHKIGGPKGVGALYARPGLRIVPPVTGEQEGGLRPGTENVPGIVGFGRAAQLAPSWAPALRPLKQRLWYGLVAAMPGLAANGPDPLDPEASAPHILNLDFSPVTHLPAEPLLHALEAVGIACSAGSACSARRPEPSHVLVALGVGRRTLAASLRFSLGPQTTPEAVDAAIARVPAALGALVVRQ
jgi:cysteine desulfurase